ncbi:SpoVG family protein [bacterium]|nr:SpoVG family protein [bacterium]
MFEVSRLHRLDNGSTLKAFADVLIGDLLLIKGVRVVSKNGSGLFVSMPTQKAKDGKWYEIVRLLDNGTKQELQEVVLRAYNTE